MDSEDMGRSMGWLSNMIDQRISEQSQTNLRPNDDRSTAGEHRQRSKRRRQEGAGGQGAGVCQGRGRGLRHGWGRRRERPCSAGAATIGLRWLWASDVARCGFGGRRGASSTHAWRPGARRRMGVASGGSAVLGKEGRDDDRQLR
uniref:Uncharacterized protein n=1 Tax=Oryza nivara TaxID=4536 RepID=A0A0E0FLC5_ORYNI